MRRISNHDTSSWKREPFLIIGISYHHEKRLKNVYPFAQPGVFYIYIYISETEDLLITVKKS